MKTQLLTSKRNSTKEFKILGIVMLSLISLNMNAQSIVNLKLFIQGYYVSPSQMKPVRMIQGCPPPNSNNVTTGITVELRDAVSPYAVAASIQATLNTDGTCVATFPSLTGQYYLNVRSCNSLSYCSALPIVLGANPNYYDFSISDTQTYGGGQVEVNPGIWAFISGDVNQDGNIGILDLAQVQSAIFNSGCLCTDLDGDGNVGLSDLIEIMNNMGLGGIGCP